MLQAKAARSQVCPNAALHYSPLQDILTLDSETKTSNCSKLNPRRFAVGALWFDADMLDLF